VSSPRARDISNTSIFAMETNTSKGFDSESTAESIGDFFDADVNREQELYKYRIDISEEDSIEIFLEESRIERIFRSTYEDYKHDEAILYGDNTFEVPVRSQSPYPRIRGRDDISSYDNTNGIGYEIGYFSDEYLVFLINLAKERGLMNALFRYIRPRKRTVNSYLSESPSDPSKRDIFNFAKHMSFGISTLKIKSEKERSLNKFNDFADSYMFELSYNLDSALVLKRGLDEFLRPDSSRRHRRSSIDNVESPKRFYNEDLIYHYQMGVSSYNPSLKYLSFYHIAEHFFDTIFNEDLVKDIEEMLTQPDFSYRRKSDISEIIKKVSNRLIARQEDITYSEREALKLTLYKHLNVQDVKSEIRSLDSSLVDHYKTNKVEFANDPKVNLENDDEEQEIGALASRIYDTRNSIVHSKSGSSERYIPFKHDRELRKEIPLVRFISEQLIIGDSKLIRQ